MSLSLPSAFPPGPPRRLENCQDTEVSNGTPIEHLASNTSDPPDSLVVVGTDLPGLSTAPQDSGGGLPGTDDSAEDDLEPSPFGACCAAATLQRAGAKARKYQALTLAPAVAPTPVVVPLGLPAMPKRGLLVPARVPQQTFAEARAVAIAIADAPDLRHWREVPGIVALQHVVPGRSLSLRTRFIPGPALLAGWEHPPTSRDLAAALQELRLDAVLLLHVLLVLVREYGRVTVPLEELRQVIGWRRPHGDEERASQAARLRQWLLILGSLHVTGRRPGSYPDPENPGCWLDLTTADSLIHIEGADATGMAAVPERVTIVAGTWFERLRGYPAALPSFGDVRRLASLPTGKASGSWALGLGLALQQRWREYAQRVRVECVAATGDIAIHLPEPLTRRDLLGLFRGRPDFNEVLGGNNPQRAEDYWNAAVQRLKAAGLIPDEYRDPPIPSSRKGWQVPWLDQPLEHLHPTCEDLATVPGLPRLVRTAVSARWVVHTNASARRLVLPGEVDDLGRITGSGQMCGDIGKKWGNDPSNDATTTCDGRVSARRKTVIKQVHSDANLGYHRRIDPLEYSRWAPNDRNGRA
jgi:hypothetical protein